MSRSPKYTLARFRDDVLAQLNAVREERQERRRRAEEQRRRLALAKARATASNLREALGSRLDHVQRLFGDQPGRELTILSETLAGIEGALDEAGSLDEVSELRNQLAAAAARLDAVELQAHAIRARSQAAHRADADAALGQVDAALRARFDPDGVNDVRAALAALDAPGLDDDVTSLEAAASRARTQVVRHMAAVRNRMASFDRKLDEVREELSLQADRWAQLEADVTGAGIPVGVYEVVPDVLTQARDLVAHDDPVPASDLLRRLAARLDDAERDIDAAIDRITERRQLMSVVAQALPRLGFAVDADSLTETGDGTIGIRAQRPRGDRLSVVVQDAEEDGARIFYTADAMASATARGGKAVERTCVDVVKLLEQLRQQIAHDGIETGPLDWEGKDDRSLPPARRAVLQPHQLGADGASGATPAGAS